MSNEKKRPADPAVNDMAIEYRHQLSMVETARLRAQELQAHLARLDSELVENDTDKLIEEEQDLLASRALGEDVSARLAEVKKAMAASRQHQAEREAEIDATKAGLSRKLTQAETDLAQHEQDTNRLAKAYWISEIGAAAIRYEALAEQTTTALADLQAIGNLLCETGPLTAHGLSFNYLDKAMLPRVKPDPAASYAILSWDRLAHGSEFVLSRMAELRARLESTQRP
jgi:multidrug efflux pump subunit AcrA (membrane-fusion protein)